jgi:hypothetical protein
MENHVLERSQVINRSLAETFEFFCDAFNLERITPPFLKFRILNPPPISLQQGTLIDYQLSLFGLPFRWRTLIEQWKPGERFVDRQLGGPYALWQHTHTFEALGPDRTLVRDRVEYRLPLGFLGRIAHRLWVRRTLETIFDYRAQMTDRLLNQPSCQNVAA